METPLLYRQLIDELSQWMNAKDLLTSLVMLPLTPLPQRSPPKAYAIKHFQQYRESLIEFSKVVTFS
jgi:hypothetical protein